MQRRFVKLFLCFLVASVTYVWAQAGGTLSGKITTAAGAAVPNAAVMITNTNTNASQRVLTGPDGSFSVAGLPAGTYRVEVESAGFKRMAQQNIELTATGPVNLTIAMEPGAMQETVEIKGKTPMVQDGSGEVSNAFATRSLREYPVIDRNHQEIVKLMTGITPPEIVRRDYEDPARNRWFSTNGQSPLMNRWYMDGVMNTEPYRGTAMRVQPVESLMNMHVVTSNAPASQGFGGGAQLFNLTRPGTNPWHGSLFEFHNNNNLNARSFFNVPGNPKPRFVYNQFGATVGGAVVPDKVFFFGSYEGAYQRGGRTQVATVPTPELRAGNFSGIPGVTIFNPFTGTAAGAGRMAFPNATIPSSLINRFSRTIVSALPLPNQPGLSNNLVANVPFRNDGNKADGKLDFRFSDRTSAFLRYGYTQYQVLDESILGSMVGTGGRARDKGHNAVASFTHSLKPMLVTEFRFGYNRYDHFVRNINDQSALLGPAGLSVFDQNFIPSIQIAGLAPFGTPANIPMRGIDNTFNWVNNWNAHTSRHDVKWGFDIRWIRSDGFTDFLFGPRGGAFFGPGPASLFGNPPLTSQGIFASSLASFLVGAPSVTGTSTFLETPTIRTGEFGVYISDNIKLSRRVTADLGVRWEVYRPLEPRRAGGAMAFDPATNTLQFAGLGRSMRLTRHDYNNVAPRIGLAFRVTDKTVIRGGYAMSYFRLPFQFSGFMPTMFGNVEGVQGSFVAVPGAFGPGQFGSAVLPAGFTVQNGVAAPDIPLVAGFRTPDTPYIQSFSAQVQQELGAGFMLNIGYVGTLGRHLDSFREINAALPGTGIAGLPFGAFGRTSSTLLHENGLNNNYNSLQVNLTKRFSYGVSFQGAYTYSKALGYTDAANRLLNPFDLRANYGPMDWDRMHVLHYGYSWELPFGTGHTYAKNGILANILGNWQLNGIFHWATGAPFTVTADSLACLCPGGVALANVTGPVSFPRGVGPGQPFFSPAAFSVPVNSFGNLGRNALRGPDGKNFDLSLFKSFRVRENFKLEFRGEAYNVTNTPRFMNPVTNLSSPEFGQIVHTFNGVGGRQINLGVRALF